MIIKSYHKGIVMVINAYPRTEDHGTQDKSRRNIPYQQTPLPQALPKVFIMNDRGPVTPQLAMGGALISLYGKNINDENSPYFKHTNMQLTAVYGNGGFAMVHRLVDPKVANTKANLTIYLDILEDDIDVYERHSDGSYVYDENGDPVVDKDNSPFKGYRVKWIAEINPGTEEVGNRTMKTGTMKDSNGNKSTMYPIFDFRAADPGSFYNNLGFGLDAFDTSDISKSELENYKTFPFKFVFYQKPNAYATPVIKRTIDNAPSVKFTLKSGVKDPISKRRLELKNSINEYYQEWDYKEIEAPYVYENYVSQVLGLLYSKEAEWRGKNIKTAEGVVNTDTWYDFLPDIAPDDEKWMLNPITFRTLSKVPYFGFQHDTSAAELASNQADVTLSKNLPVFLGNGVDGDISDATFEQLVQNEMEKYLDKNGPYFDPVVNVETLLVDSGFGFETKKSLVNFITVRKDTVVLLSTYTFNKQNKTLTLEEERAIGLALNNRCQLALESYYYDTPVARGVIVGGSGVYKKSVNGDRYPLTMDLLEKVIGMMGKPQWDKNALFDRGELDIIKTMVDIEPKFIPESVKQSFWGANINYPEPIDRETYVFPAIQTVYPYDNSVLNNLFTVMAIAHIHKLAYVAQRRFSGNVSMSDAEFLSKVDAFINTKLADAFAGMFNVKAKSTLTDFDKAAGYSWTTNVSIESTVMKTVMKFGVEALRK